ncbi:MAG TPA: M20 family metallopeptidase, partial [Acetomicrobium hydrogeniformans]|nr:M20 family metallopeptidase [Acetomicrobium hydrogeniformans]
MEISYERLVLKAEDTVDRYSGEAVALSDYLAEHPEVSEREFQSSKRHAELLRRHGFEVEYPFLDIPTAFCAKKSNGEGAKVALLVEYDALPEIGHACGHCLHGAMSTLAGIGLAPLLDEGDIKG